MDNYFVVKPVIDSVSDSVVVGNIMLAHETYSIDLIVSVFSVDGKKLLGSSEVDTDNNYSIGVGGYTGVVIVQAVCKQPVIYNSNGVCRYIDDINLFAVGFVGVGAAKVNINALTTIAAQAVGVDCENISKSIVEVSNVHKVNREIAKYFW